MTEQENISRLRQRLIESLFNWDVFEFDARLSPEWVVHPFFMRLGRALGTGKRLRALRDVYKQLVLDNVHEDPDFVYGPAHKGIPLAALTAMAIGEDDSTKPVSYGFNLPGDATRAVQNVITVGNYIDDVSPTARIWLPFSEVDNSKKLREWAKYAAQTWHHNYNTEPHLRNLGFNLILGDGSAIPAAAALAAELAASYDIDPYFAIPRRTEEAVKRAADTLRRTLPILDGNRQKARLYAAERLFVGYVPDHARYLLVSPHKEETDKKKSAEYEFGAPMSEGSKAVLVDDSRMTGRTTNTMTTKLRLRYGDLKFLGGFYAVDIQEVPPDARMEKTNATLTRNVLQTGLPMTSLLTSWDIANYLHRLGKLSDQDFQKAVDARRMYGAQA
ncbi:MAG: hypothetical protein HY515_01060 [Candidatus Aenigmarchaeota archaeon]|nr:hypothetical protein [Candidatus Aenigmarchaeota archaeon]